MKWAIALTVLLLGCAAAIYLGHPSWVGILLGVLALLFIVSLAYVVIARLSVEGQVKTATAPPSGGTVAAGSRASSDDEARPTPAPAPRKKSHGKRALTVLMWILGIILGWLLFQGLVWPLVKKGWHEMQAPVVYMTHDRAVGSTSGGGVTPAIQCPANRTVVVPLKDDNVRSETVALSGCHVCFKSEAVFGADSFVAEYTDRPSDPSSWYEGAHQADFVRLGGKIDHAQAVELMFVKPGESCHPF